MAVDTVHPEYSRMLPEWQRNLDAIAGEQAIKRRRDRYLPVPNAEETTVDDDRYASYLKRAVFTNYTGRTVRALTGAVFRLPPTVELPVQMEYLLTDADNGRLSLETIAQRATASVLGTGRYVVLADYPEAPMNATAEQTEGLRAYLACYPATALINWHETNGMLDLAVLHEVIEEEDPDGFSFTCIDYYRVLRMVDGKATVQLYRESTPEGEPVEIKDASGTPLDELPLVIIGAEDNNVQPDTPPISDIASLNVAHYQAMADRRESSHLVGQPTLHIDTGETSAQQFVEVNGTIQVGSRTAIVTNGGGSVNLVSAPPNDASRQDMIDIEDQLVRLGAQIIMQARGAETAEGARIRSGNETSVLHTIIRNVGDAFEQCLRWCALFEGQNPDDVSFALNRELFEVDADPQLLAQLVMGVDRGAWTNDEVRNYARRTGLVGHDVTNEDLEERASTASPIR